MNLAVPSALLQVRLDLALLVRCGEGHPVLWYIIIVVGFIGSARILYHGFRRTPDGVPIRFKELVIGRKTLAQRSRRHLLLEGFFMLSLTLFALIYRLAGW